MNIFSFFYKQNIWFFLSLNVGLMNSVKQYGRKTFIGCCVFTAVTIGLVLYDEHLQRERRQVNVKYRLLAIQQKENRAKYEVQKQRVEEIN